jgi:hypothetical protein
MLQASIGDGHSLYALALGKNGFAAQAFQHDADLLFGRKLPARRPPDVLDDPLCWRFIRPVRPEICPPDRFRYPHLFHLHSLRLR